MAQTSLHGHDPDSWAAATFGLLVQAAEGKIQAYHSDLYRDAEVLQRETLALQPDSELTLCWSVGKCGSHIGTDSRVWRRPGSSYNEYDHYKLILARNGRTFTATLQDD